MKGRTKEYRSYEKTLLTVLTFEAKETGSVVHEMAESLRHKLAMTLVPPMRVVCECDAIPICDPVAVTGTIPVVGVFKVALLLNTGES